jgi:hypothetical protein
MLEYGTTRIPTLTRRGLLTVRKAGVVGRWSVGVVGTAQHLSIR